MATAKTKQALREGPDNSSGSSSDGSWTYDGSVGSWTEPTTDTCSRSNTAKASSSEDGKGNHPRHVGVSNGNNRNSGLPLTSTTLPTLMPSTTPIRVVSIIQDGETSEGSLGSSTGSSGSKDMTIVAFIMIGGTLAIIIVGVCLGIVLLLQKWIQSSPGRTTSSIASSHFREAYSDHAINISSQQKHEAHQKMVGGELNQATSPSIMNASESSRVKPVLVPSMTDYSTDPFRDDATIGSFVNFTPTSVDTFEGLELAEQGELAKLIHPFNMNV